MRYLLLATLGTALFFGVYWLLMRREKRFDMVRCYLLGTLVLALVLPLVHITLPITPAFSYLGATPAPQSLSTIPNNATLTAPNPQGNVNRPPLRHDNGGLQTIRLQQHDDSTVPAGRTTVQSLLLIVYLTGAAVAVILLASKLLRLRRRLRPLPYTVEDGIRLSLLDDDTPAFSFGNHIVVGCRGFSPAEIRQLIGHEKVHIRQRHTLDLLLCELAKTLLWFNPMVYLYQRELKRIHEFIADNQMLSADDGADYAALFYHQVSGKPYCPIANTFDYGMIHQRIAMMARHRTRCGWLKPLAALPLVAVLLLAGCQQKGALDGLYTVSDMALMSDNPNEPTLQCSEFLSLENRLFHFHPDGRVDILNQQEDSATIHCTYKLDDNGLHIFTDSGKQWLDMQVETVHCDADSIVLRFVDPTPMAGMGKMLSNLPTYRYRIDTVDVSTSTTTVDGQIIEVFQGTQTDTVFAHVTVPCQYSDTCNWNLGNRLLGAATNEVTTFVHQYKTQSGDMVEEFGTTWEFRDNALLPDAQSRYDTVSHFNPSLPNDRFILSVTLKKK